LQNKSASWIRSWVTVGVRISFKLKLRALEENCIPSRKLSSTKTNINSNPETLILTHILT